MGSSIGRITSYFSRKEDTRILMVGLDAAGKTTILYTLKFGDVVTTIPTIGFNVETVEYKNIALTVWDVGGRDKIRPLWRHYYQNTNSLIFVVDSNDRDRVDDASEQIRLMLNEDELRDKPVLILANKQDLPNAMTPDELKEKLALEKLMQDRKWHLQPTVAVTGNGLHDAFKWLAEALETKNVQLSEPFVESAKDSKMMKDDILSMFKSINLKALYAKFT